MRCVQSVQRTQRTQRVQRVQRVQRMQRMQSMQSMQSMQRTQAARSACSVCAAHMQRIAHVHGARRCLASRRDADHNVAGRVAGRRQEAELRCARHIDRAAIALE